MRPYLWSLPQRGSRPQVFLRLWDEEALRAQIAKTARAARGCPLEITFRDITTVHGDPTRLGKAVEIARRAAMENWQP